MDATPQDRPQAGDAALPPRHVTMEEFIASDAFDAAVLEAGRIGVARAVEADRLHKLGKHSAAK